MSEYEDGCTLLEEKFGKGKDNIIALATMACDQQENGLPLPVVRGVDAYYEDRVFYITTHAKSNKMIQIERNPYVSVASVSEMFTASGIGENIGWIMDPNNARLRQKLREAFAPWYDKANNEKDENCCILAIRLTKGILNINHWEKLYYMDFVRQKEMTNGGII